MWLVDKLKKYSNDKKVQAKLLVAAKVYSTFNELIDELKLIVRIKKKYNNKRFWKMPQKIKLNSPNDEHNFKILRKHILSGEIGDRDIDYIAGRGMFKGVGLIQYLEESRDAKIRKLISDSISSDELEELSNDINSINISGKDRKAAESLIRKVKDLL